MSSRTKNSSRNVLWGLSERLVSIIFPFIVRTVMIYSMELEYVGLDSLFISILQVLSFAELGIGSALVFSMYKPFAESKLEKVGALLYLYKRLYVKIGCVIVLVGLCILPFIKVFISGDVKADVNIYILYLMYLVNNAISYFLFTYKQSLLIASQRVDLLNKITLSSKFFLYTLQIVLLISFHNYYIYVAAIPLSTLVTNYLVSFVTSKLYSNIECKGEVDQIEINIIKKNVKGMVFQKIGGIVLNSSSSLVISSFLGLVVLAKFQNYYYIILALFSILAVIYNSVIPSIGNSVASQNVKENYPKFKIFNLLYIWIVSIFLCCLLCLFQPFVKLWIGEDGLLSDDFVILIAIYFYCHKFCDILFIYQEACGIWWQTRFTPLISSIVNLILSLVLIKFLDINGVLIATILSVLFVYIPGYSKALFGTYFKEIKKAQFNFFKTQFILSLAALSAATTSYYLCSIVKFESTVMQLCFNLFVSIVMGNFVLLFFYFNLKDFKSSYSFFERHFLKKLERSEH